jgi:hypothetical protein
MISSKQTNTDIYPRKKGSLGKPCISKRACPAFAAV